MAGQSGTKTGNRRAEQHLIAASELINALDSLDESVVIFDERWHYQFVNKKGWEVLDRPKGEVLGKNVWELMPHLIGTDFYKTAHRAMEEQKSLEIEEYYPHRHEWFKTKFYPSRNSLVSQMQNITDLVEARQVNDLLNGTLEQAMEVYWRKENRERREKDKAKSKQKQGR